MLVYLGVSLIRRTLTVLVHAGLFRCFLNPPNMDMDYRVCMSSFCMYIYIHTWGT